MKKCWKLPPADRPRFSDLVTTLDKTLSSVAGYTELSMTLLEPGRSGENEEWPQYEDVLPPASDLSELSPHDIDIWSQSIATASEDQVCTIDDAIPLDH